MDIERPGEVAVRWRMTTGPRVRIATLVVAVIVGVLVMPVSGGAATDPMLRFEVTDPVVEGAAGTTTTVTIAANLDRPADHEVRWRWLTFDQPDWVDEFRPATPGVDYIEAGGVLTFAPGATTASIDIDVLGDGKGRDEVKHIRNKELN